MIQQSALTLFCFDDLVLDTEFIDELDFDRESIGTNLPDLDDLDINLEESSIYTIHITIQLIHFMSDSEGIYQDSSITSTLTRLSKIVVVLFDLTTYHWTLSCFEQIIIGTYTINRWSRSKQYS